MFSTPYRLMIVHRRLDAEIRRHSAMRVRDNARITKLKKLKLALKDQLHGLALGRQRAPRAV